MLIREQLLHLDNLSLVMIALVGYVALCVGSFSIRYLDGDRRQMAFYCRLAAMILTVFVMVCANHLLVFLIAWTLSNLFLVQLMLHKVEWRAARESYYLAIKGLAFGFVFLVSAFIILYAITHESTIHKINRVHIEKNAQIVISFLILLAAMAQSSLWPFHRWLISSLNSPTPVSAIMHAGLVNGGGFLLVRFAPFISNQPVVLNGLFVTGMITALLGSVWKLMQSDIKRMLACSTMGQMGFMVAQCGLGLFPAAIAHLCWHGFFKAYLFLASGAAAQQKRFDLGYPPTWMEFLLALICSVSGTYLFALTSKKMLFSGDTNQFLIAMVLITGIQFALPIVRKPSATKLSLALFGTTLFGAFYGLSVYLIESILAPLGVSYPQTVNALHGVAMGILCFGWLSMLFIRISNDKVHPNWVLKAYVRLLNASQPHPKTITTHRKDYQF